MGALVLATTFCGGTRSVRLAFDSVVGNCVRTEITGALEKSIVGFVLGLELAASALGVGAGGVSEGGTGVGYA